MRLFHAYSWQMIKNFYALGGLHRLLRGFDNFSTLKREIGSGVVGCLSAAGGPQYCYSNSLRSVPATHMINGAPICTTGRYTQFLEIISTGKEPNRETENVTISVPAGVHETSSVKAPSRFWWPSTTIQYVPTENWGRQNCLNNERLKIAKHDKPSVAHKTSGKILTFLQIATRILKKQSHHSYMGARHFCDVHTNNQGSNATRQIQRLGAKGD